MAKGRDRAHHHPLDSEDITDEELTDFYEDDEDEEEESLVVDEDEEPEADDDDDFDDDDEDDDDFVDDDDDDDEPPLFEDEVGYNEDFDWDSLSEAELSRHESFMSMDKEELEQLSPKRISVFDRWAAAQAFARVGMREAFQEACRSLLRSRRKHPGLAYDEIYLELISDLADDDQFDEAFSLLDKFIKQFPEETGIERRVRGLLLIESGKIHDGKSLLDDLMKDAKDHGELHLEIGDDLVAMGHAHLALRILERGKELARKNKDTELITAIDETLRLAEDAVDET